MLVLTRKKDEGILIGKDITITIIDIDKDKVRIGIAAPKEIRVIRQELVVLIGQENRMAAQSQLLPTDFKKENLFKNHSGGEPGPSRRE